MKYEQAEHMSRHQLDEVNAALDIGDRELMLVIHKALYGEKK